MYLEQIRKLVTGTLSNAQNASLFSSGSVQSITNTGKEKRSQTQARERNSMEDAEVVRQHCILLRRFGEVVTVFGRGRHEQTPVLWSASWSQAGEDAALCIDPQGLFHAAKSGMEFSSKEGQGPIFQAQRRLLDPEEHRALGLVRRLKQTDTDLRVAESETQMTFMPESLALSLHQDIPFFHTLCHMTGAINGAGFWTTLKNGSGEDGRLTCAWDLGNSSYGFLDMPSRTETLQENAEVVLSQGNMRTLSWILDRFKGCNFSSIECDGQANRMNVTIEEEELELRVMWTREQDAVSGETQEVSLARVRRVQTLSQDFEQKQWTAPHPLIPLAEGLGAIASFCPPVLGREGQACIIASVDPNLEDPAYVFRGRNTEESAEFRLGSSGKCQDLPMWIILAPEQAKLAQLMIKTISASLSFRTAYLHLDCNVSDAGLGHLLLRGRGGVLAGGFFSKPREGHRILKSKKSVDIGRETPFVYVKAPETMDLMKSTIQFGMLNTLSRSKNENKNLVTVDVENGKLRLEMGSDNHVAGGYADFPPGNYNPKAGGRMFVRVKPTFIQSVLDIFGHVMQHSKVENRPVLQLRCHVQVRMGDNEGLTLSFVQKDILFARVRTVSVEEPYFRGNPQSAPPSYVRLSPHGQPEEEGLPLPERETLRRLALLHKTFALEVPTRHCDSRQAIAGGHGIHAGRTHFNLPCGRHISSSGMGGKVVSFWTAAADPAACVSVHGSTGDGPARRDGLRRSGNANASAVTASVCSLGEGFAAQCRRDLSERYDSFVFAAAYACPCHQPRNREDRRVWEFRKDCAVGVQRSFPA